MYFSLFSHQLLHESWFYEEMEDQLHFFPPIFIFCARREITSATHFREINDKYSDPIKWWNHEVQIKEACDIQAWHSVLFMH